MIGLLIKDFYTLFRQMKIMLLIIILFTVIPGFSASGFAVVYAVLLPISAIAYDERSKWDCLAAMMPYSSKNLVLSKYLLGLISLAAVVLLTVIVQVVKGLIVNSTFSFPEIVSLAITLCVAIIMQGIVLPLMFKMGVEKGRLAFFIVIGVVVFAGVSFGTNIPEPVAYFVDNLKFFLPGAVLAALVINLFSIKLSTLFYRVREF